MITCNIVPFERPHRTILSRRQQLGSLEDLILRLVAGSGSADTVRESDDQIVRTNDQAVGNPTDASLIGITDPAQPQLRSFTND